MTLNRSRSRNSTATMPAPRAWRRSAWCSRSISTARFATPVRGSVVARCCRMASDRCRSLMSRTVVTMDTDPPSATRRDVASVQRYEPSEHRNRYVLTTVRSSPAADSLLTRNDGRSSGWMNSSSRWPWSWPGSHPNRPREAGDTYRRTPSGVATELMSADPAVSAWRSSAISTLDAGPRPPRGGTTARCDPP